MFLAKAGFNRNKIMSSSCEYNTRHIVYKCEKLLKPIIHVDQYPKKIYSNILQSARNERHSRRRSRERANVEY